MLRLPAARTTLLSITLLSPLAAPTWAVGGLDAFRSGFEENRGQLADAVLFASPGPDFRLELSESGAALRPLSPDGLAVEQAVRVRFQGGDPSVAPQGEAMLPGRVHYYRGSEPGQQAEGVRRFGQVRYPDVYPGIDVVHRRRDGELEYAFFVEPGADPSRIAMRFEGAGKGRVESDGSLVVEWLDRTLAVGAPLLYQQRDRERSFVPGEYRLNPDGSIGFQIGAYDADRPLVIDPVLLGFSSRLGGSAADQATDLALDPSGFLYVTGSTESSDFLGATAGGFGGADAFVAKLAPDGASLVYVTVLGGAGFDLGVGVAVDAAGSAYVSGHTESADFPTTPDAFDATLDDGSGLGGGADAFLVQLTPDGQLDWASYYGGFELDGRFDGGVAIGPSGIAYIAGRTMSPADLPTQNAFQTGCAVTPCAFAAGFDTSQSGSDALVYGSYIGGNSDEAALSLAVDGSEDLYVFGFTSSTAGLVDVAQAFQTSTGDTLNRDHFLVKLDPSLAGAAQRVYSSYIGGTGDEVESGEVVAGAGGLAWVVGDTSSSAPSFPVKNALQAQNAGNEDGYLVAIDTSQTGAASLRFATFVGGAASDRVDGVTVDSAGNVILAARGSSVDFPVLAPLPQFDPGAFVMQLSPDGQSLLLSTPVAAALRVEVDANDDIVVLGNALGPFPLAHALPPSPPGGLDLFLARLEPFADSGLTLELESTADPVREGGIHAYQHKIVNNGSGPQPEFVLASQFPPGLDSVGFSANCTLPTPQGLCEVFDPIEPGQNVPIYLRASAAAAGEVIVQAFVDGDPNDPDPADNLDAEDVTVSATEAVSPALALADFDRVANAQDIGAFSLDTPRGVLATPNGSLDDAVNFMVFDGAIPLHLIEILGQGEVAFGLVERGLWTPSEGDGSDLFGREFNAATDRVFAIIDSHGRVELRTASGSGPGRVVAEGVIDLFAQEALSLEVDFGASLARVLYGSFVVAEGDPFTADPDDADQAQIGDDQVITVGFGTGSLGSAILSDAPEPERVTLQVGVEGAGSVAGPGIACPGDCQEDFFAGSQLGLQALPDADQRFDGWTDACAGELSLCTLTLNTDASATARFVAIDADGDGIEDDGDASGVVGDAPCTGGAGGNVACDDNCRLTSNADQSDADADTRGDACDNCVLVANLDQLDLDEGTDDDTSLAGVQHYGDICDVDLDNDGIVGPTDFFGAFRPCIGLDVVVNPVCQPADLDGDGVVGPTDFFGRLRPAFGTAPGPGVTE